MLKILICSLYCLPFVNRVMLDERSAGPGLLVKAVNYRGLNLIFSPQDDMPIKHSADSRSAMAARSVRQVLAVRR